MKMLLPTNKGPYRIPTKEFYQSVLEILLLTYGRGTITKEEDNEKVFFYYENYSAWYNHPGTEAITDKWKDEINFKERWDDLITDRYHRYDLTNK